MRLKTLATTLACAAVSLAAAAAAQGGVSTETWNLYDCSGPPGTPSSFSATRPVAGHGNALHVDGGGTFVLYAYNADAGLYNVPTLAPGTVETGVVQCSALGPKFGAHFTLWGFLTP